MHILYIGANAFARTRALRARAIERPILDRHRRRTRPRRRRRHQFHRSGSQPAFRDLADRRRSQRSQDQFGAAVRGRARRAPAAGRGQLSRWLSAPTASQRLPHQDGQRRFQERGVKVLSTRICHCGSSWRALAGRRAAAGRCQRSADRAQPHVARAARERRGHLGVEVRAEPVERAGVHLRDHARGNPALRRAQHSRGAASRAQPAGDPAHVERILQSARAVSPARPTCRTSPTRS